MKHHFRIALTFCILTLGLNASLSATKPTLLFDIKQHLSPHKSLREPADLNPFMLILHYNVGSLDSTIDWFQNDGGVSSHYIIGAQGEIVQFVSLKDKAWHAGLSEWDGLTGLNNYSIGIETENMGPLINDWNVYHEDNQESMANACEHFTPYTNALEETLIPFCQNIVKRYKIQDYNVLGHNDVSPGRKADPGPLFPWEKLHHAGVGAWFIPEELPYIKIPDKEDIRWVQNNLADYGYKINKDGNWGEKTRNVIQAFQMHFRPADASGRIDTETMSRLASLVKRYPKEKRQLAK